MIQLILVLSFVIIIWSIIYPLTDFSVRFLARRVVREGNTDGRKICLSFDDGPDPVYTPSLLSILKEASVPATFFLVGAKAELAPGLVKRIMAEGHEIGAHTYYHKHAYLMFLKKSLETVGKGKKALDKITGQNLVWFRPPWGALNLFEYLYLKHLKMEIVLWSANAHDWEITTGALGVLNNLKDKVKPNTIIVLHDSGGDPGAPANMLQALPELILSLKTAGFQFVTLSRIMEGIARDRD